MHTWALFFFVLSQLAEKSTDVDVKEHGKSVFSFLSSAKQLAAVHSDDLWKEIG